MIVKYTPTERLQLCYLELESLEIQLDREFSIERGRGQKVQKASRITKYKISILKRNIENLERLVNGRAENWENWNFNRMEIETELDTAQKEMWSIEEAISTKQSELLALVTVDSEANNARIAIYKTDFGRLNKDYLIIKKKIDALEKELVRIMKKEPSRVSRISKDTIMRSLEDKETEGLPSALQALSRDIRNNERPPEGISAMFSPRESSDVDVTPLKASDLYPDVSFMFEGREKDESENEGQVRETGTVASDKDAPDS